MSVSLFVLVAALTAATATAQEPAFEVVSIKPSRAEHPMMQMQVLPGGRFVLQNASLRTLLAMAFDAPGFEIVGTPEWAGRERYDIEARPPAAWTALSAAGAPSELWPMVRSLLRDRFGLVTRREPREFDGFALVLDSRGSVGPRLKATDVDCRGLPPDARRPGADGRPRCGMVSGAFGVRAGSIPISDLTRYLSQRFGRPVRDDTQLEGSFDFELEFAPEQATQGAFDSTAPSLNVALREQLGLRLETRRVTRSVVVVESVHRPTEN